MLLRQHCGWPETATCLFSYIHRLTSGGHVRQGSGRLDQTSHMSIYSCLLCNFECVRNWKRRMARSCPVRFCFGTPKVFYGLFR
eukprot:4751919-Amphidinium_carterae.1